MPDTHRAELGPRPRGVRDDDDDGLASFRPPIPRLRASTGELSVAEMDGARLTRRVSNSGSCDVCFGALGHAEGPWQPRVGEERWPYERSCGAQCFTGLKV